jgi:protein-S-isoprenylcysteine O-methyltransferase Ste14
VGDTPGKKRKEEMKMRRALTFLYGAVAYAIFFATFCYAVGFVRNFAVPKSIDSGSAGPFWESLMVNVALLGLFGIQHSGMARPGFKRVWTKVVPKPIERSTFVLFSCFALILMFWQWRPMPATIWSVQSWGGRVALEALAWMGLGIVLISTCMIHHFDLFGLRQVYLYARGKRYTDLGFRTPGLYRYLRHPIMLGFLIAFWVTPVMTVGHLLFAAVTTAYILVALQFEERDLTKAFGARYEAYKQNVPMLLPAFKTREAARAATSSAP